jgi:hypothetical protein
MIARAGFVRLLALPAGKIYSEPMMRAFGDNAREDLYTAMVFRFTTLFITYKT